MRKIITIIATIAFLIFCVAYADTSVDMIKSWLDGGIGEGETFTKIELAERKLTIEVNLGEINELYDGYTIDFATERTSSITDLLLDHTEFDKEWDEVFIGIENIGFFVFSKEDIELNEYNMRYFNVYDEDYNSKIRLSEEGK